MAKLCRALALLASCVMLQVHAHDPGIRVSLSTAGLQYLTDFTVPIIEKAVSSLDIPGISLVVESFNISISNFQCGTFSINGATVGFPPQQGAGITLQQLQVDCTGEWSFYQVTIHVPSGSGEFNLSMTTGNASLFVDVGLSPNGYPVLSANDLELQVDNVDIQFSGSSWDWLLDLVRPIIVNALQGSLEKAFQGIVTEVVDNIANNILQSIDYDIPIPLPAPYDVLQLDISLNEAPVFNTTYAGFGLQGAVEPVFDPQNPDLPVPDVPSFNEAFADAYIQAYISSYTAQSAFYSLYTAGLLTWVVPASSLPFGFNRTSAYSGIAPDLPTLYPNSYVSIYVLSEGLPTFSISPGGISGNVPMMLGFNVNTSTWGNDTFNAFILTANAGINVSVALTPTASNVSTLFFSIGYANVSSNVAASNVGPVNVGLLTGLIDFVFSAFLIPAINAALKNGIPIPTSDGNSPGLVSPQIYLGDGYLGIRSNFTF